jgi:hypothetical protein
MDDFDDGIWAFPEDVRVIAGSLWRVPAFTCRSVSPSVASPATYAASSCRSPLVKPTARLIFTPWVFGKSMHSAMHA